MSDSLQIFANLDVQATQGKTPTASLLAYSGGVMRPQGISTIVIVDGVKMPETVPLLGDHQNSLSAVLGSVRPRSDGRQIYGEAELVANSAAAEVIQLAKGNVPLQASIGLRITKARWQAPDRFSANGRTFQLAEKTRIVEASELFEISVVPLGADHETSAAIAAKRTTQNTQNGEKTVTDNELLLAERERVREIDKLCRGLQTPRVEELRASAIAGDLDLDALKSELLMDLRAELSKPVPSAILTSDAPTVTDPGRCLEAALLLRGGLQGVAEKAYDARTLDSAYGWSRRPLPEMLRAAFRVESSSMSNSELVTAALTGELRAAGTSTTSLPQALSNTMGRSLAQMYREAPSTWRAFAGIRSAGSFFEHRDVQPQLRGDFLKVGKDGAIKSHEPGEQSWPYRVETYGRRFSITRQDLINDSLSFFATLPQQLGRAAARAVSDEFYKLLLNSGSHYVSSASIDNLETASPLSLESLAAGIQKFRTITDADGKCLDLQPAVLLVPPSLEVLARSITDSLVFEPAEGSLTVDRATGNALRQIVQVVVEPRIENSAFVGASSTSWYLMGSPADSPFLVSFLEGRDAPTVETLGMDSSVEYLALGLRAFLDFGVAAGDQRASIKFEATS